jgi:hypothetical protein
LFSNGNGGNNDGKKCDCFSRWGTIFFLEHGGGGIHEGEL